MVYYYGFFCGIFLDERPVLEVVFLPCYNACKV